MTGWLIFGGIAAGLLLLGAVPVGVHAVYDADLTVCFTVLGIRFRVYPRGEKKPKKDKTHKKKDAAPKEEKSGKKLPDRASLDAYLRLVTELLGKLRRKILIRQLTLHAIFGGGDAADTALNYGRAWAAIGVVTPLLEQIFRIQKRDIGAFCGEDETTLRLYAKAAATLTIAQILHIFVLALKRFIKIRKNQQPEKAVQ